MVENSDIDKRQGIDDATGDGLVGRAWLGVSRGVVVSEDDGARVVPEGSFDNLPRMDSRGVDGTEKQYLEMDDVVAGIEEDAGE